MSLGERLLNLRKEKHLSQEEVADKINVSRQTISKWETDQSTPDFDKIMPLCKLYEISADELLTGKEEKKQNVNEEPIIYNEGISKKRAIGIGIGVLLYFFAIAFIAVSITVFMLNPIIASSIFLLIIGFATFVIIYTCIIYKKRKVIKEENKEEDNSLKGIKKILSLITLIIYLLISFASMAWHITWIIWIIYALVLEIVKLSLSLRGDSSEK